MIEASIDQETLRHLNEQFDKLKSNAPKAVFKKMVDLCLKIKANAQNRLRGRSHIDSSRLRNSIYVQAKDPGITEKGNNSKTYSDDNGKSYDSTLKTVSLSDFELSVGSNVTYAAAMELGAKPHVILPKNKPFLAWGQKASGYVQFGKGKAKKYYTDKNGSNTLEQGWNYAKKVNHPGYKGDSFLYWGANNVDVDSTMKMDLEELMNGGKFSK